MDSLPWRSRLSNDRRVAAYSPPFTANALPIIPARAGGVTAKTCSCQSVARSAIATPVHRRRVRRVNSDRCTDSTDGRGAVNDAGKRPTDKTVGIAVGTSRCVLESMPARAVVLSAPHRFASAIAAITPARAGVTAASRRRPFACRVHR